MCVLYGITLPSILMLCSFLYRFSRHPIFIICVSSRLSFMPHVFRYVSALFISFCALLAAIRCDCPFVMNAVSSAYSASVVFFVSYGFMSLMKVLNRQGPRADPCGTPACILCRFDFLFSTCT